MKSHSGVASIKHAAFLSCANPLRCEKVVTISGQHPIETRDSGCQTHELSSVTVKISTTRKGCDKIPAPSGRFLTQKFGVTDCVSRPPLQRELYDPCWLTARLMRRRPLTYPSFRPFQNECTADDLTGGRANSESDACLLHISYCKTQRAASPLHESSRILAMTGPGIQQNSTTPVSAAGRSQRAHEWRRRAALPRRLLCTLRSEPFNYLGLHVSLWRLCRRSACYFCRGDPRLAWELGLNPPCDLETSGLGNCGTG